MRRIAAFTFALLLVLTIAVSATTAPAGTTLPADTTSGMTADTTTDTSADTTAATTTAPTTAKPTEPRVESENYTVEQLPKGAAFVGNDATWVDGRAGGRALQFDGTTNYMEIDIESMEAPFTLSMWVNWQADIEKDEAQGQRLFTFQQKHTENSLSMTPWLYRVPTDNAATEEAVNGIAVLASCYKDQWFRQEIYYPAAASISTTLPVNSWHHIAVTVEQSAVTVYIDGMQWKRETLSFAYADLKADLLLIGGAGNGTHLFQGLMEDVQLFESALTAVQVARLAANADPFDATVSVTPQQYAPAPMPENAVTEQTQSAMTLIDENGMVNTMVATPEQAFWEAPVLSGGQSLSGTLTVENKSKHIADMQLESIALPAQGTPAWEYLSDIHITVSNGQETLYSGPYTGITTEALKMQFAQTTYGRSYTYTITMSRPLMATAAYTAVSVPWTFVSTAHAAADSALPDEKPLTWLLILLPLSAAMVGFSFYWAMVRPDRRIFAVWDTLAARIRPRKPDINTDFEATDEPAEPVPDGADEN